MTVHAYIRPRPGDAPPFKEGVPGPAAKAIQAYADAQGFPAVTWWIETSRGPTRLAERVQGAELLRSLREGDTLLAPSLGDLVDYPTDLDALVRGCVGRGITVEVVATANADRSRVLKSAIDAFSHLEAELTKARDELARVQTVADERLRRAQQIMAGQLIENFGLPPSLALGVPSTIGDVHKAEANGHVGTIIKAKREAKGLSQEELGLALGMPAKSAQGNVSKLETGRSTYMWQEALAHLGGENA